jgi:hypothetical protein
MIDARTATIAFQTVVSLALLSLGLFLLHRDFFVERLRDALFRLRDELFDFAASGGIRFSHPAYGMLREIINGHIRFAHKLSFLRATLSIMEIDRSSWGRREVASFTRQWSGALEGLDDSAREKLIQVRYSMHVLLLRHLLIMSPIFVLFLSPGFIVGSAAQAVASLLRRQSWARKAEANADFVAYESRSAA